MTLRALAVLLTCLGCAPAQEGILIRCVDREGDPVAKAEVTLFQYVKKDGAAKGRYVPHGPYVSDGKGHARCPKVVSHSGGKHDRWVVGRIKGRMMGFKRSVRWEPSKTPAATEILLVLAPTRAAQGEVIVPDAYDATKVKVRVRTMHVYTQPDDGNRFRPYESFPRYRSFPGLDVAFKELFEVGVDAEGSFTLPEVPEGGRIYLLVEAPGLGQGQYHSVEDPDYTRLTVTLEREGVIEGQVFGPDDKPVAGVTVTARLEELADGRLGTMTDHEAVSGSDGSFRITGLPSARVQLSVRTPPEGLAFLPMRVSVTSDSAAQQNVELELAVRVQGVVVDDEDDKPVVGANVGIVTDDRRSMGVANARSDAKGRFSVLVPRGALKIYLSGVPKGYRYPEPQGQSVDTRDGEAVLDIEIRVPRASAR